MNTKNNSLFRETSRKFENALTELLNDYPIEQITVNMLCDKAGLHRATFYTHYYNIYELLDIVSERVRSDLMEQLNLATSDAISVDRYIVILRDIKKNKSIYKIIIHSSYNSTMIQDSHNSLRSLFQKQQYDEVTIQYMLQFWRNGISSVISKWIQTDCNDDIEKVAEALHKCSLWIS